MKTLYALRTASLAIAMSLGGAVQAQAGEVEGPAFDSADVQTVDLGDLTTSSTIDVVTSDVASNSKSISLDAFNGTNFSSLMGMEPSGNVRPMTVEALDGVSTNYGDINPMYRDITAFWGNINPFYRDINPFYRDINPFYRDINPFYRDINPFWRDINPFYRDINPFYGDIVAFWGDINPFYRDIVAFDSAKLEQLGNFWIATNNQFLTVESLFGKISYKSNGSIVRDGAPNRMMNGMAELIAMGEAQFGAAYTAKTGNDFSVLVEEIFARHGVQPYNKAQIELMTAEQRAALYLDWHDTLMLYSGINHVDYWMSAVNWTPALTQIQQSSSPAVVGVIDADFDGVDGLVWSGGSSAGLGGHGAGVASLIFGAHDGEGVMGIAPHARVIAYNPFDASGTTSWDDVASAILSIKSQTVFDDYRYYARSAGVINLSLGEAGWTFSQGLADVFRSTAVANHADDTLYVIAAGNDGISQTQNIAWDGGENTAFILVGSIGPDGNISSFSNRPGSACLTTNGQCLPENQLYNHFIVAPGEMLLVDDGMGGVVRRSGTSLAAPLVSGAVTLLHARWPWLENYPETTADIIFQTAQDLGAPGVDPVYGWGLLDVTASQSPIDFNNLSFMMYRRNGNSWDATRSNAEALLDGSSNGLASGLGSWWETDDVFFQMFEEVGPTWRDFQVPMSAIMAGKREGVSGENMWFQDFIAARMANWIVSGGGDSDGDGVLGLTETATADSQMSSGWTLQYDTVMPRFTQDGAADPVHNAARLRDPSGKFAFTFGYGQGSMALASGGEYALMHHSDRFTGGVNPILGFASGETFGAASYRLNDRTEVSFGFSENRRTADEIPGLSPTERFAWSGLDAQTASAMTVSVEHKFSDALKLNGQYTQLREDRSLLGTQAAISDFLDDGSESEAFTLSANVQLGSGISFDLSATGARTDTAPGQVFRVGQEVFSTAGQVAVNKRGVLGARDVLRVSVAQPLNVEAGKIEFTMDAVVDRETGEIGPVTQSFDIGTKRRIAGEVIYGTPVGKRAQLSMFGHYLSEGNPGEEESFIVGANIGWRF